MSTLHRALEPYGIWWHSQNLNEDSRGNPKGSKFWHGRSWFKWKEGESGLGLEWLFGRSNSFCHAYIQAGGEDTVMVSVALPHLFALWLHVETKHSYREEREIGLSLFQGLLSWKLWSDSREWHEGTPRWRDGSFNIPDFVLGKRQYNSKPISEERVFIQMPEECYRGTCRISQDTWKRPRWPWPLVLTRATIDMDKPIPFPGKGENSWDQGEDGTYLMTMCASTKEEAAKILRDSVLKTRKKRAGGHD